MNRLKTSVTKRCPVCKQVKSREEFYAQSARYDGLDSQCKECSRSGFRQRYQQDPHYFRARARKNNYGISAAAYDELLAAQGGVCAICKQPETATFRGKIKQLSVDHDHLTGQVRGLLCVACNAAIGHFEENAERMLSAMAYLKQAITKREVVQPRLFEQ